MHKQRFWNQVLVLGLIIFAMGILAPFAFSISWKSDTPEGTFWTFAPPRGVQPDYSIEDAGLFIMLKNETLATMTLLLRLSVHNLSRTYEIEILQPLQVIEDHCIGGGPVGNASLPFTSPVLPFGFFTRCEFKFWNNLGRPLIGISVTVTEPIMTISYGKRGMSMTFFGGKGLPDIVHALIAQFRAVPITNIQLGLTIDSPTNWSIVSPETSPPPDREERTNYYKRASWKLLFADTLRSQTMTVVIQWLVLEESAGISLVRFLSEISIPTGTMLASAAFSLRTRAKSLTPKNHRRFMPN